MERACVGEWLEIMQRFGCHCGKMGQKDGRRAILIEENRKDSNEY